MADMTSDRRRWIIAWALCLFTGLAVGVSGFSSGSNHPTYLPPGLRYVDPTFLAHDWWLNTSRHYHFAFFVLTAALAKIGVLEIGLAVLNILAVAAALHACFRLILWLEADRPLTCLAVLASVFLGTATFNSVGESYLFMPSLQPSSVAAAATLLALVDFLEGRSVRCGLWLGLAGLFHANFLVANAVFFGLLHIYRTWQDRALGELLTKRSISTVIKIFCPSLLIGGMLLPLVMSVQTEPLGPAAATEADWIFFRFAVAYHYYPLDNVPKLLEFLVWQVFGFLWTSRAAPDPAKAKALLAVQVCLSLILWSATALTTLVFLAPVSRLYLWRLAPFAVLISVLVTTLGAIRAACQGPVEGNSATTISRTIWASIALTLLLLAFTTASYPEATWWHPRGSVVMALLFLTVAIRVWGCPRLPWRDYVAGPMLMGLLLGAAMTLPDDRGRSRYSLLYQTPVARDQDNLFAFVRTSTPINSQFLIPPMLDMFRLEAQRAILVDYKAMPINRVGLIEWYRRLSAISGVAHPANMNEVHRGYASLDVGRLERLRDRYHITHVVLPSGQPLAPGPWTEIYRNRTFKVLELRGPNS